MSERSRARGPVQLGQSRRPESGIGDEATIATERMKGLSLNATDTSGTTSTERRVLRGRKEEFQIQSIKPNKHGNYGEPVQLTSNYYPLTTLPQRFIYQYHVYFNPTVESISVRNGMIKEHAPLIGINHVFDGQALFSTVKLHHAVTDVYSLNKRDDTKVRITIKFNREISPRDPILQQILNIQMRKNFTYLEFKQINRKYFDCKAKIELPNQRLEIYPGFSTSILQHESAVLMNLELDFKIARKDTVLDLMKSILQKNPRELKEICERALLGKSVMTVYNSRTYRIDQIDWATTPKEKFTNKDGSEISFIDYMNAKWKRRVLQPDQPMLLSRPSARDLKRGDVKNTYILPEYCVILGLDEELRGNFKTMRALDDHTKVDPNTRVGHLTRLISRMNANQNVRQDMDNWAISVPNELVKLTGRNLGPQRIVMSDTDDSRKEYPRRNPADWSNQIRENRLLEPVRLSNWVLVCNVRNKNNAAEFLNTFRTVCGKMGIEVKTPMFIECADDRTQSFAQGLQKNIDLKTEFVVVIVPNDKKDRYDAIKKLCLVDLAIPNQVIVSRTLDNKARVMSIITKIAIQINCKMGGQAWRVPIPLNNAMVIGIDTYHDTTQRNKSVSAMVFSTNKFLTKFYSRVSFQSRKQEMTDAFGIHLLSALKHYHSINRQLPSHLIVYRDGVGDGQLAQVKEWEIQQMHEAISRLNQPNYKPQIAFIVVNKRINTRFFQESNKKYANPLPGTVVDDVVTRPERYDFFLVSQSVREGTVAPTQYNVIFDTTNLDADKMQRLTYMLTHLYYNWQGTISVPAPCQYAHKLAYLVGENLHMPPNEGLADVLYFL